MNRTSAFQPKFGSPVSITALDGQAPPALTGSLLRVDGRVLTLTASELLRPGTPVRVDVEGGLVLGEVVGYECAPDRSYLSVKIDQVIPSVSELAALVRSVMEVEDGPPRGERVERRRARAAAG